jgi:hypothetical protein
MSSGDRLATGMGASLGVFSHNREARTYILMQVALIIPALNEEPVIGLMIQSIPPGLFQIIVVADKRFHRPHGRNRGGASAPQSFGSPSVGTARHASAL